MKLSELYLKKYGGTKTAKPDFAPGVKEKGVAALIKKDPTARAVAKKVLSGKEEGAREVVAFLGGKVAGAAFFDELERLNNKTISELEKQAFLSDPLIQLIRSLS